MPRRLRLGTRGSVLSLAQTKLVSDALTQQDVESEAVIIQSRGDREPDASLTQIGGQGVFVRALEEALLDGRIDAAVHSAKDAPPALLADTEFAACLPRADVRDALVARPGTTLETLPDGARVGTGSRRRAAQMLTLRPDLRIADIRGNVDTRLRKLAAGDYDAIILAAAGLQRLRDASAPPPDWSHFAFQPLPPDAMLPAPGQGVIAIQTLSGSETRGLVAQIDDRATHLALRAERALLRGLGAGCTLPVAALAHARAGQITLAARLIAPDGSRRIDVQDSADQEDADGLGARLAERALNRGGRKLMEQEAS